MDNVSESASEIKSCLYEDFEEARKAWNGQAPALEVRIPVQDLMDPVAQYAMNAVILFFSGKMPIVQDVGQWVDFLLKRLAVRGVYFGARGVYEVLLVDTEARNLLLEMSPLFFGTQMIYVLPGALTKYYQSLICHKCPVWVEIVDFPRMWRHFLPLLVAQLGKVICPPKLDANTNRFCILWDTDKHTPDEIMVDSGDPWVGGPSVIHPIAKEPLLDLPLPPSDLPPTWLPLDVFLSEHKRKGLIFIGRDTPSLRARFSPLDSVSDTWTEDRVVYQLMFAIETRLESIRVPIQDLEELCEQSEDCMRHYFGYRISLLACAPSPLFQAERLRARLAAASPAALRVDAAVHHAASPQAAALFADAPCHPRTRIPLPLQSKMEKYQEQGQLLEPFLESMVCPLMEILRKQASANPGNPRWGHVKKICSVIYTLVTVCGYKTVVKFFPHHVSDLELAVELLESSHGEIEETSILREESTGQWETKCCLLLWLSILVLVPFDIASVDTSFTETDVTVSRVVPPLVGKIVTLCKDYLASPGPMREMAGVLLSRLLTRPDMPAALRSFMTWTQEAIAAALENSAGVFLVPGVMGAVAAIFKAGGRDILYPVTSTAWEEARQLSKSSLATQSLLLRKFLVKLVQRIGLVYLPQRTMSWQYKGANSVIMQNLSSTSHQDLPFGSSNTPCLSHTAGNPNEKGLNSNIHTLEDDDVDVADEVEDIIGHLLISLRDKDTIVRWSAAKGVGRITGRLTLDLADEVVASVLELLNPAQGDGAWHGGCLALAELARRGLLIPSRLAEVVPLIVSFIDRSVKQIKRIVELTRSGSGSPSWDYDHGAQAPLPTTLFQTVEQAPPASRQPAQTVPASPAVSTGFSYTAGTERREGLDLA
ncbi:hypothetical protein L7F22_024420 [Adiantum nelumboides]|nr:hypothetical protein [Adiantum nelumboides]